MRIGFFIDQAYPGGYGVEVSMETFRRKLEELGHETYVYAPHDRQIKDENKNIFRLKAWRVKKNPKMFFSFPFFPVGKSYKELTNFRLDIVHAQSPLNLGTLAGKIARHQKIPLICTVHTDFPAWIKANLKDNFFLPRLIENRVRRYCNGVDAVIAPSAKIKNRLEEMKIKKPIRVLGNCVDLEMFKKNPAGGADLRKKYGIPALAKVMIFVGSLSRQKNTGFLLDVLAEIMKKRNDVFLVLVGAGDYKKDLKKKAEELGITASLKFAGFIPHEEVAQYYNMSDIFVMASLSEIMPLVVLEAQACGLPAVVLDEAAFHDTINSGVNGFLVKEKNPVFFAEKALKLLEDGETRTTFSAAAEKMAANFSIDNQTEKLLNIYREFSDKNKKI